MGKLTEMTLVEVIPGARRLSDAPRTVPTSLVQLPSKCDSNTSLILDRTNFFLEFYICFYRSRLKFEIKLKS
jgi:hypothetical protein